MKCPYCETKNENLIGLKTHCARTHKKTAMQTYIDVFLGGKYPSCKCGCGEIPRFMGINQGFREHVNEWHDKAKQLGKAHKQSMTKKKRYELGEIKSWNEGLSKETNSSLKLVAEKVAEKWTDERRREGSKRMRELRKNGLIVVLKGKDAPGWKGGMSTLISLVANQLRPWKQGHLKRANYLCERCNASGKLVIHHSVIPMHKITAMFVDKTKDYTIEERQIIADKIAEHHIINRVPGEVLCLKCHKDEHDTNGWWGKKVDDRLNSVIKD